MPCQEGIMSQGHRLPEDVADELAAEAPNKEWLRAVTDRLDDKIEAGDLAEILSVWDLSQQDLADAFGVTRQSVSKWLRSGVPADRAPALADLASATEELKRRIQRERIPAVVRRSAETLGGRSLLKMAQAGEHEGVLRAVKRMFDLMRIQP